MVASVLTAAGHTAGLYTSPHLHTFRERICLGQTPLSEAAFASLVERLWPIVESMGPEGSDGRPTTFEMLTAMAFACFRDTPCDAQVIEVGMGGTLDATNVVEHPLVCVLTSISLDHTQILGHTVGAIARDKSGIIKRGAVVVTAPQTSEAMTPIEEACQRHGAGLVRVADHYRWERGPWDLAGQHFRIVSPRSEHLLWMPLLGEHQLENAAVALAVVEALEERGFHIGAEAVQRGFKQVEWPCRLEVLKRSPLVVADGAHNPYSIRKLGEAIRSYFRFRRLILVFGCSQGHDLEGMVAEASALDPSVVFAARSRHPRAVDPATLARAFRRQGALVKEVPDVTAATIMAQEMAEENDLVLVTGSLFITAEARELIKGMPPELYPEV
jgi:dihydrofolate synthase/folylpolyglutamate synthase